LRHWLLNKRNEKEFTQEDVANKADMRRSTYSMIELGQRNATVTNAKKIANVLDFDWTIFFEDKRHDSCNYSEEVS